MVVSRGCIMWLYCLTVSHDRMTWLLCHWTGSPVSLLWNADCDDMLQNVVDRGLRDQKWYDDVEGTYMRLDITLIMPHLLNQLEERKQGECSWLTAALLILRRLCSKGLPMLHVCLLLWLCCCDKQRTDLNWHCNRPGQTLQMLLCHSWLTVFAACYLWRQLRLRCLLV